MDSSIGTGALNSPVLLIESPSYMKSELEFEKSTKIFATSRLRFHLSLEDVEKLLKYCEACETQSKPKPIDPESLQKLTDFMNVADFLKTAQPPIEIGKRRKHALIGQDLFKEYILVQVDCVTVLIDPKSAHPDAGKEWPSLHILF